MRTASPPMPDHAAARHQRRQREHDGHQRPRRPMRYLLASGQARSRQQLAHWLGVHRNTMRRWRALDAAGGLEALRQPSVPAGNPVSLAPAVLAGLEQVPRRPAGFAA